MVDSLVVASYNPCLCVNQSTAGVSNCWDTVLAIAMVVIAAFDIVLTVLIFVRTRKDSSESEQKNRKFELVQSLILNHRLHLLYEFYDAISNECLALQTNTDNETKKKVDDSNKALLKKFRLDFIMLFNVIDSDLYRGMMDNADKLIDGITEAIFDEGINLTHAPKYNEMITVPLSHNRNSMIAKLYSLAELGDEQKQN